MVSQIVNEFRRNANFSSGEVSLFQELARSIVKYKNGIFVDETHGNTCKVEYSSIRGVKERCEISDLLIVAVNKQRDETRATFWQAKREEKPQWIKNSGSQLLGEGCFDFKCQFNQWELLNYRHDIAGLGHFSPPQRLLSSFLSPSITSYGVFYESNGLVDLNYSVAELVASSSLPKVNGKTTKASPRMSINGKMAKYLFGSRERVVCNEINDFISALLAGSIGAEINLLETSHRWLVKYIRSQVYTAKNEIYGNDREAINDLLPEPPDSDSKDQDDYSSGGFSILVVENSIP